jgi:hypothetical protein
MRAAILNPAFQEVSMRRMAVIAALVVSCVACGKDSTPTTPSTPAPTPAPTPTPAPAANRSPVISNVTVTPGFGMAPATFQLSGSATDPDNDSLNYSWSIVASGSVVATFSGPTASATFQTLLKSAVARLVVSDGKGGTATADSAPFNVGSMTGNWVMTSAAFPGVAMLFFTFQQAANGAVTGQAQDGNGVAIGQTDPAGGAVMDGNGNLQNLRIKFLSSSNAVDFTLSGQMQPSLDVAARVSNTTATFAGVPINGMSVTLSLR